MNKKELASLVKTPEMPLGKLLTLTTEALIGVSSKQAKILQEFKIDNINDLGLSEIFRNAVYISSISNKELKPGEALLPPEMVQEKATLNALIKLKDRDPALLTGVGDTFGRALKSEFGITSILELANWPPFRAARRIVNEHLGIATTATAAVASGNNPIPVINNADSDVLPPRRIPIADVDPEAPQDLVPKTGDYPVEIVYYDSVVMIDAPKRGTPLQPLSGRVALSFDDTKMGYDSPGFGAILTFKQSWFAEGITLGSLLKSIALAPGESTKIAVIDWQRTTTGSTGEEITQGESLSSSQTQSRAISEIADATATELQGGSSLTGSTSTSANSAVAAAGMAGPVLVGGTASASVNVSAAATVTASAGQRDISSNMQQNIDNSTQQNSFAARNKRSSVVTEVSQAESETISTRTITNYNHMHALTIQYWQVVQAFYTEVKVDRYKRCIFVPMDIINFRDERVISKFKTILYNAARTQYIRVLLSGSENSVTVFRMAKEIYESKEIPPATELGNRALRDAAIQNRNNDKLNRRGHIIAYGVNKGLVSDYEPENGKWKMSSGTCLINADLTLGRGDTDKIDKINIVKEDGSIVVIAKGNIGVNTNRNGLNPAITEPIPLSSIVSINVELKPSATLIAVTIGLFFKLNGNVDGWMPIGFLIPQNAAKTEILKFQATPKTNELASLLNEDALYYSQKIWMNFDPHFLTMQLSPYKITVGAGTPNKIDLNLTEYIDPKPIAVMGNCLAFIWHDENDAKWNEWKKININEDKVTVQKIALPTDGIFGEAVLGRFNSAEKLDMTRFWNWQDSPIPFAAPDIAAIQAGNHQVDGVQRAGSLDPSLLSIQAPQALPDPTGMQAVLQGITVANLFRDMSGVAQTSALAQGALSASAAGATAAGAQAGANMATFANFQVEMAKIAASLAPMLLGLPPLPVPATKNISNGGAAMNLAKVVDAQQAAESDGGGISPAQLLGGTAKQSNQQKVLEQLTNTKPPQTISFPSTPNFSPTQRDATNTTPVIDPKPKVPGSEKKKTIFPPEISKVKDILEKAADSPEGITEKDQNDMLVIIDADVKNRLIPALKANAPDFEKLRPVLRSLLDVIATGELVGVGDELRATTNEAMKIAQESTALSLNNTIDLAKSTNSFEKLKLAFVIVSTGNLLGFEDDKGTFDPNSLASKLQLSVNVETDLKGPTLTDEINTGDIGFLKVFAELAMGDNDGITSSFIEVGIIVKGGVAEPSATGKTDDVGRFVCNIKCTDRAQLSISGKADTGIPGVSRDFVVNI